MLFIYFIKLAALIEGLLAEWLSEEDPKKGTAEETLGEALLLELNVEGLLNIAN